jgi:hypothetical protein
MRIWFKMPDASDTAIDWIIEIATREGCNIHDVPCHVVTEFSDGRQFSAQYGEGARWKNEVAAGGRWESIDIPSSRLPFGEEASAAWCDSIVDKSYDYLGAGSSATRLQTKLADHYFCSGVSIAITSRCGLFGIPELLNPLAYKHFLSRLLAGEDAKALAASPEFCYRGDDAKATALSSPTAAFFSPAGGCSAAIVATLAKAVTTLDVAMYQLTRRELVDAIVAAANRGVVVRVIVDPEMSALTYQPLYKEMLAAGCQVKIDHRHHIFHDKVAVIDGATTINGSFNWTDNAELKNAENLLATHDAAIAAAYANNFEIHWGHSVPFNAYAASSTDSVKTTHAADGEQL